MGTPQQIVFWLIVASWMAIPALRNHALFPRSEDWRGYPWHFAIGAFSIQITAIVFPPSCISNLISSRIRPGLRPYSECLFAPLHFLTRSADFVTSCIKAGQITRSSGTNGPTREAAACKSHCSVTTWTFQHNTACYLLSVNRTLAFAKRPLQPQSRHMAAKALLDMPASNDNHETN
jgi:hypothetical protein